MGDDQSEPTGSDRGCPNPSDRVRSRRANGSASRLGVGTRTRTGLGSTCSTFRNAAFCYPQTVYTYYDYVRAYGYPSGSISGTRSTDSVDECAPLWMHYQVRKVT